MREKIPGIIRETSKEQYEEMAKENLFRLRTLVPVSPESKINPEAKSWDLENWRKIKEQFLNRAENSGKNLEDLGTSPHELELLETRTEAIHWLQSARHSREIGPNRMTKGEAERIIDMSLKAIGSSSEEIKELQKKPAKRS